MTLPTWITEIESRLEKATQGRWEERFWRGVLDGPNGKEICLLAHGPIHANDPAGLAWIQGDSALIAHAPTDLRRLVAFVWEQETSLGQMREAVKVATEALKFIAVPGALQTREDWQMKRAREALAAVKKLGDGN